MNSTYTRVLMEVSPATYKEIRDKLEAAEYFHAIDSSGNLDMQEIAINVCEDSQDQGGG